MSIFFLLNEVTQKTTMNEMSSSSSSSSSSSFHSSQNDVVVSLNGYYHHHDQTVKDWNYYDHQYQYDNDNKDQHNDVRFLFDFPDNISHHHRCYHLLQEHVCPNNHTLLWKILQFSKVIVIKVGKKCFDSISIITCLFWIISLLFVFTIGLWIGRTWERKSNEDPPSIDHHNRIPNRKQDKIYQNQFNRPDQTRNITRNLFTNQIYFIILPLYSYIIQGNLILRQMIDIVRQVIGTCLIFTNINRKLQRKNDEQKQSSRKDDTLQPGNINNMDCSNSKKGNNNKSTSSVSTSPSELHSVKVSSPPNYPLSVQSLIQSATEYCRMFQIDLNEEDNDRTDLKCNHNRDTICESGITDINLLPSHIAIIMDGNRRYGQLKYNNTIRGHYDGCKKLIQMIKWCIAEKINILTVYALSTENWSRSNNEINSLLLLIVHHCEEIRIDAIERNVCIKILSTDIQYIPESIQIILKQLEYDTKLNVNQNVSGCTLHVNICLSYSGRNEIIQSCQKIVNNVIHNINYNNSITKKEKNRIVEPVIVTEEMFTEHLLTSSSSPSVLSTTNPLITTTTTATPNIMNDDNQSCISNNNPDILIRTSGESRISNFLLYQLAYTEMFFLYKNWPDITKDDFILILQQYSLQRQRRFGK